MESDKGLSISYTVITSSVNKPILTRCFMISVRPVWITTGSKRPDHRTRKIDGHTAAVPVFQHGSRGLNTDIRVTTMLIPQHHVHMIEPCRTKTVDD